MPWGINTTTIERPNPHGDPYERETCRPMQLLNMIDISLVFDAGYTLNGGENDQFFLSVLKIANLSFLLEERSFHMDLLSASILIIWVHG